MHELAIARLNACFLCYSFSISPSRLPIVRRPLEFLTQKTPPGCPIRDSEETAGGRCEYAAKQVAKITHHVKGLELCDALAAQLQTLDGPNAKNAPQLALPKLGRASRGAFESLCAVEPN